MFHLLILHLSIGHLLIVRNSFLCNANEYNKRNIEIDRFGELKILIKLLI